MYTKILGYYIYNGKQRELIKHIEDLNKVHIISGNPEVLYNGMSDKNLFNCFTKKNSIIIPDGVGTVLASKIMKNPVKEKIAGVELMESLIKKCEIENKSIYLLGAKEEVLNECIKNLKLKYPNINICGSHNGYFNFQNCDNIVHNIKVLKPYALFVAMGSPRQEKFIVKYMDKLPCSIFMGVGGSFDIFAGKSKRAPKWMIKLGVEWLYRVLKEPWRIKRLSSIPKFLFKVIISKNQPI